MRTLDVGQYDPERDQIEIEGTKYSGELFRAFGCNLKNDAGKVLRIDEKKDGVVTITRLPHFDEGNLYLVGRVISKAPAGFIWDVMGLFADQADAENACANEHYFVGPLKLGERLPVDTVAWPGAYFPKLEGFTDVQA